MPRMPCCCKKGILHYMDASEEATGGTDAIRLSGCEGEKGLRRIGSFQIGTVKRMSFSRD